jgi:mannose-6-phosphate isomerase-like protein (cupin superfamily)
MAANPIVLAAGEGRTVHVGGEVFTFKVTGTETGGAFDLFEMTIAPGGGPPLHIHRTHDETYRMLEGRLTVQLGTERVTLTEGMFVFVPRGTPHAFLNSGATPARMLLTMTPASWDTLLQVLIPTTTGQYELPANWPDIARDLMQKNDTEVIGPPLG